MGSSNRETKYSRISKEDAINLLSTKSNTGLSEFKNFPQRLRNDCDVALKGIEQYATNFKFISERLKNDKFFLTEAMKIRTGTFFQIKDPKILGDKEFMSMAACHVPAFKKATSELLGDPDFCSISLDNIFSVDSVYREKDLDLFINLVATGKGNISNFIVKIYEKSFYTFFSLCDFPLKDKHLGNMEPFLVDIRKFRENLITNPVSKEVYLTQLGRLDTLSLPQNRFSLLNSTEKVNNYLSCGFQECFSHLSDKDILKGINESSNSEFIQKEYARYKVYLIEQDEPVGILQKKSRKLLKLN